MSAKETESGRKACREAARTALENILKERSLPDNEGRPLPAGKS
jgi:hypothetical protein